jgi:hypothetical protein
MSIVGHKTESIYRRSATSFVSFIPLFCGVPISSTRMQLIL